MSILKTAKRPFSALFYSLLSHAPAAWERKLSILLDVWGTDPRRIRKLYPAVLDFQSAPDLETDFPDLDAESLATLRRFVASWHFTADSPHLCPPAPPWAWVWSGICTQRECDEALVNEKRMEELKLRYHLRYGKPSSLIHHHGLKSLPAKVLDYLRDTVFIDAGAFEGDSTLVFLDYKPRIVWAFEPSPPSQKIFHATMKANAVPQEAVRLLPLGLSDKPGTIHFSARATGACALTDKGRCKADLVTLDSMTPPTRIGLIKADLEGMLMYMLRGAAETIKRDKPVLTLNFYHNPDEFRNTYAFVRSLGDFYDFKVVSFYPPWNNLEVALLAWPSDLS